MKMNVLCHINHFTIADYHQPAKRSEIFSLLRPGLK